MSNVFVNGTFDVIHMGHLSLLEYASTLGSVVVVAIDSDTRVKRLKGQHRPINTVAERRRMLEALRWVNHVHEFDTDQDLCDIIKSYRPVTMVKGSDYQGRHIVGKEFCDSVVFFERLDGYSTTEKIQDIVGRR